MTYLESFMNKYKNLNESVDVECFLIDNYCPGEFGSGPNRGMKPCERAMTCDECWYQEIPEKKEYESPCVEVKTNHSPNYIPINEALNKPQILDSGNRREFETGAVRDIQEGKGRCDLMPLDVVGEFRGKLLATLSDFQETGLIKYLRSALQQFIDIHKDKDMSTTFLEVSKHFEEGAKKYGENNWQKGIPVHCYIDSAVRHYLKFMRGDFDEPHDRAFCWNIMCAIWTCKHKPELNEYRKEELCEKDISKPSHS